MLDLRYFILLVAFLAGGGPSRSSRSYKVDAGTPRARAAHAKPDGGIPVLPAARIDPDAGTAALSAAHLEQDAGAVALPVAGGEPDAGAAVLSVAGGEPDEGDFVLRSVCSWPDAGVYILPDYPSSDAGTLTFTDGIGREIHWPERARPIAVLEGSAVIAAHAALQHLVKSFAKERPNACTLSAKAMDVMVSEHDGIYFVHINQRVDRCGFRPLVLGTSMFMDWFELYAVSPEGKVLARYPYCP